MCMFYVCCVVVLLLFVCFLCLLTFFVFFMFVILLFLCVFLCTCCCLRVFYVCYVLYAVVFFLFFVCFVFVVNKNVFVVCSSFSSESLNPPPRHWGTTSVYLTSGLWPHGACQCPRIFGGTPPGSIGGPQVGPDFVSCSSGLC